MLHQISYVGRFVRTSTIATVRDVYLLQLSMSCSSRRSATTDHGRVLDEIGEKRSQFNFSTLSSNFKFELPAIAITSAK